MTWRNARIERSVHHRVSDSWDHKGRSDETQGILIEPFPRETPPPVLRRAHASIVLIHIQTACKDDTSEIIRFH